MALPSRRISKLEKMSHNQTNQNNHGGLMANPAGIQFDQESINQLAAALGLELREYEEPIEQRPPPPVFGNYIGRIPEYYPAGIFILRKYKKKNIQRRRPKPVTYKN